MDWGGSFKFINYNESDFLSAGNVVEVVKKLPSIHVRPWVQSPGFHKTHLYTASQTGSKFQGPPRVHSQFKDIMDYVRPCLETNTNNIIFQHSLPIYFWSSILTSQQPGKEVMKRQERSVSCLDPRVSIEDADTSEKWRPRSIELQMPPNTDHPLWSLPPSCSDLRTWGGLETR